MEPGGSNGFLQPVALNPLTPRKRQQDAVFEGCGVLLPSCKETR